MKSMPSLLWLCLALGAGCSSPAEPCSVNQLAGAHNLWIVPAFGEDAARAAVVRERTLHPQHFDEGRAALNELGLRDVAWLAQGSGGEALTINLHRAGADDALYAARVDAVRAAFEAAGLDAANLAIAEGLPGGDGATSERASKALEAQPAAEPALAGGAGAAAAAVGAMNGGDRQ
jgi:hypothetical protein